MEYNSNSLVLGHQTCNAINLLKLITGTIPGTPEYSYYFVKSERNFKELFTGTKTKRYHDSCLNRFHVLSCSTSDLKFPFEVGNGNE